MAIENFNLVLQSAKMLSPNTRHLVFKRADGLALNFIPGQFITFLFPTAEGKPKRRSYSVATIPGTTHDIEIAISYVKGGVASETLFNMQAGEQVAAMGPAGRLVLPDEEPLVKRYILVGTGTGIAPYRAMLPEIKTRAQAGVEFVILQGVQYRQDVLYGADFLALAMGEARVKFQTHLSREKLDSAQAHEHSGYVQAAFPGLNLNPDTDVVYLCGNPNMIDESYTVLVGMGFNPKNVRREKYISSN